VPTGEWAGAVGYNNFVIYSNKTYINVISSVLTEQFCIAQGAAYVKDSFIYYAITVCY
jgi:hypothetical protein